MVRGLSGLSIAQLTARAREYRNDRKELDRILSEIEHRAPRKAALLRKELVLPSPEAGTALPLRPKRLDQGKNGEFALSPSRRGERTVCVDFGTSSIRAAWRSPDQEAGTAVRLGAAVQSGIDDASVPSCIFIDDRHRVFFGQKALELGLTAAPRLLFELSPKRWMTEGGVDALKHFPAADVQVDRRALIGGLLAHSFSALRTAMRVSREQLLAYEVRVAHPVWTENADAMHEALRLIVSAALTTQVQEGMSEKSLQESFAANHHAAAFETVDVVEPVAAALELFENDQNSRQICGLVDVGAGTTDLALMLSVTSDVDARVRRRLIPLAPPRSIPLAGDAIDQEVLELLVEKIGRRLTSTERGDLERRRRANKETLFRRKRLTRAGVEITLEELKDRPGIRRMCEKLTSEFLGLIQDVTRQASPFVRTQYHSVRAIDVVFAGGGSRIDFLKAAIPDQVPLPGWLPLPFRVSNLEHSRSEGLPAELERLAVALGGTVDAEYWPRTTVTPGRMYGLSGIPPSRAA